MCSYTLVTAFLRLIRGRAIFSAILLIIVSPGLCMPSETPKDNRSNPQYTLRLPPPRFEGTVPLEEALKLRRSNRRFRDAPLKLNDVAQVLWAAQGVTTPNGRRTSPSAGALYPLEIYLVTARLPDLEAGIYHYQPAQHSLTRLFAGDIRTKLAHGGLRQGAIAHAPATIAIFAVFERTTAKYGERGIRYVYMEAGHSAQNICLQSVALGLGSVVIGAFRDEEIQRLIGAASTEQPLYLIPLGMPE